MSTNPPATAAEMFRSLQERVRRSDGDRAGTIFGRGIHGEDHILEVTVPNQRVTMQLKRAEAYCRLRVATLSEHELVMQLFIQWRSIYGEHCTAAAYKVTLDGEDVIVEPKWEQRILPSDLEDVESQSGDITVEEYHQQVLDDLRGKESPVYDMLFDGNVERVVEPATFSPLAARILPMAVEF